MRVLLAAEGESDEIVVDYLIRHYASDAEIDCKVFPSRGWPVVRRLTPITVRAAYFGFYDVLVIHFDVDDGKITGEGSRREWVLQTVSDTLNSLPHISRPKALRVVLCAPCQSVDAWLTWAANGGDGRSWERMNRRQLKIGLYDDPPRQLRERARGMCPSLIGRMEASELWPVALRQFIGEWQEMYAQCKS